MNQIKEPGVNSKTPTKTTNNNETTNCEQRKHIVTMDSFKLHPGGYNEEPGIYVEETGKASGNLQDKELENLRQLLEYETRLEKLGQQLRKEKKIQGVRTMLEGNTKMDESQQNIWKIYRSWWIQEKQMRIHMKRYRISKIFQAEDRILL